MDRRPPVVVGFATMVLAAFLIAPGDIASKTHVALHGLCAQRPSHSLQIGGTMLPMDARMTGIYLGAAASVTWLAATRRLRATRVPSLPVVVLLASFVVALAVDGFNALLVDLRFPTLYEPSNIIRLATGVLAGTALGVALGHLFASSIWVLALSDVPLLYAPFAIGLLLAAVGVFWLLGTVLVALLSQQTWSCRTWGDLAPLALASLIAAIVTVGALSWLRFAAEQLYGLRRLT